MTERAPTPTPAGPTPTAPEPRRARWLLLACVASGVCFDLAGRADAVGLGVTLWLTVLAGTVLVAAGPQRRRSAPAALAAVFFGAWVTVRASSWLIPLDVIASLGLLAVAASVSVEGRVWSRSLAAWSVACGNAVVALVASPVVAAQLAVASLPPFRRSARAAAWARGLVLAVPLLALLGALLASADAVFASFFVLDVDLGSFTGRVVLIGLGTVGTVGLVSPLRSGAADGDGAPRPTARRCLGVIEASVVLGGLVGLYGLFALSRVVTALAGDEYVRDRAGLTYAEYARSGFFQLLAVAALTLLVLGILRAATRIVPGGRSTVVWRGLGVAAVVLSELIVASAIQRIGLYEAVYGRTMLRLITSWFAWWLGAVFLLVGAAWAGVAAALRWLSIGLCLLGGVWLAALNVVNPEAQVAGANLAGAGQAPIDIDYVATLSEDVAGTVLERLDGAGRSASGLDATSGARLLEVFCNPGADASRPGGIWTFNVSRNHAAARRERRCAAA